VPDELATETKAARTELAVIAEIDASAHLYAVFDIPETKHRSDDDIGSVCMASGRFLGRRQVEESAVGYAR